MLLFKSKVDADEKTKTSFTIEEKLMNIFIDFKKNKEKENDLANETHHAHPQPNPNPNPKRLALDPGEVGMYAFCAPYSMNSPACIRWGGGWRVLSVIQFLFLEQQGLYLGTAKKGWT